MYADMVNSRIPSGEPVCLAQHYVHITSDSSSMFGRERSLHGRKYFQLTRERCICHLFLLFSRLWRYMNIAQDWASVYS